MLAPRNVILPVVVGVWVITALVATYTWLLVQGISITLNFFQAGRDITIPLAGVTSAFLRFHLLGVALVLVIVGCGVRLLCQSEASAAHLAWYASLSVSLAAFWQTWAMLADRCFLWQFHP
jgi:hypothetical protein